MRRTCALASAALFALMGGDFILNAQDKASTAPQSTNSGAQVVGDLGDTDRLVFEGLHAFSANAVRIGLLQNMDFLVASDPVAPLNDYLPVLQNLIQEGYRYAGFPDVQSSASLDSQNSRILVKVNEGPRCTEANIQVTGAGTIPVESWIRRLTELPPSADPTQQSISERLKGFQGNQTASSVWKVGRPAPFDQPSLDSISQGVDEALKDLGWFFVRTQVKIVPDRKKGTAELLIEVLDQGSSGVIDQIHVTGLKHNKRKEVLKYLSLKPGLPVTRQLLTQTEDLLWHSARFLAFEVTPEAAPDRQHINLKIALAEYDPMPPLHRKLSREAQAFLRVRDWISDEDSPDRDLVFTLGGTNKGLPWPGLRKARIIVSPFGVILTGQRGAVNENEPLTYAAVVAPETLGLYDMAHHSKLAFAVTNSQVGGRAFVSVLPNPDPAAKDHFLITFGAGFKTLDDDTNETGGRATSHFRVDRLFAPIAFAGHAYTHDRDIHIHFSKSLMIYSGTDFRATFEEKSGKLVELNITSEGKNVVRGTSDSHAFDRALAEINKVSAADTNQAEQRRHAATALEEILDERPFAPLDAMVAGKLSPVGSESFFVPLAPGPSSQATLLSFLAPIVLRYCDDLFPRGSWASLVLREATLVVGNRGKYVGPALQRVYESDQTGPIGFETTARLLALANSPAKAPFAERGLTRVSDADFREDCQMVLDQDCVVQKCITNVAKALEGLTDGDIEALASLLSPDNAIILRLSAASLRRSGGQSFSETLAPTLNQVWDKWLKRVVEADLRKMAEPATTNGASGR